MPRRLKTYQTSLGFFDLAVAAPSMKAAAEAWGTKTNDFKRGFAKETNHPAIVAATMAKPGVVLKRPVGSNGAFSEHAELPKATDKVKERLTKPRPKTKEAQARKFDDRAAREAALAFEREEKRRAIARHKEEAAREKRRKLREQAIAKAERALERAKSTRPRPKRSNTNALHSTDSRKLRMRAGRNRRRNWKSLCAERVTSCSS
jgi:hypothetical protein